MVSRIIHPVARTIFFGSSALSPYLVAFAVHEQRLPLSGYLQYVFYQETEVIIHGNAKQHRTTISARRNLEMYSRIYGTGSATLRVMVCVATFALFNK